MDSFSVDILTPGMVLAKDLLADSLFVPTEQGEINLLPGHTHVIEKLATGELVVNNSEGEKRFCVTHGICKVLENKVTILSTVSENIDDIDLDRAKKSFDNAKKKLSGNEILQEEDSVKYSRKIERAELRIKMALFRGAK